MQLSMHSTPTKTTCSSVSDLVPPASSTPTITRNKLTLSPQRNNYPYSMHPCNIQALVKTMIVTGVLIVPTVVPTAVPSAVQDLQDLKTVIDTAATSINEAPNNSKWGFFDPAAPSRPLGTANLVSNITTTVLRATYLLNTNKTSWLATPSPTTPTEPPTTFTTVIVSTTTLSPSNVSLDGPYLDYINSLSNLSGALTALGRGWHKEMNKPVWDAIAALQQTISTFSSDLLAADLIHSPSVLRSIRASSTLEDAQQAWARELNLPGGARPGRKRWLEVEVHGAKSEEVGVAPAQEKRKIDVPPLGRFFTHKELWGRGPGAEAGASRRGTQ